MRDRAPRLEPRPRVTLLDGNEQEADAVTLSSVCWLLRRYSSLAYVARAQQLFRGVVEAFMAWPDAAERCPPETLIDLSAVLRAHQFAFTRGVALLERGDKTDAYAALLDGARDLEPADPRDERHLSISALLDELGDEASVGGKRAAAMALRIQHTLSGTWAYERILADRLSLHFRPRRIPSSLPAVTKPDTGAPSVPSGRRVPVTGIWFPDTIRYGCPNFLVAGTRAPELTRESRRYDYAELRDNRQGLSRPAWSDFDFTTVPTRWRLLWEDARYREGVPSDEADFLDEDNANPIDPDAPVRDHQ